MATCRICKGDSRFVSDRLGICLHCIRNRPEEAIEQSLAVHHESRRSFGLPESPPGDGKGVHCRICVNACDIPEGALGYCGLRANKGNRIVGVSKTAAKLSWYHDPLPTNCVANWVCPGGTGCGFPVYSHRQGPEIGYDNLAVFFHACTFNCLFCQNWQFKQRTFEPKTRSVKELVDAVGPQTSCVCFFGGDPAAQTPYTLKVAARIKEVHPDRIIRICWETNGCMNEALLQCMLAAAFDSGGCIKFDLKAWDDHLHRVLTGVTNRRTLKNFGIAANQFSKRPSPPPVVANTLLVPGYIDEDEVEKIATFIASINPDIPYSLLVFHPQFLMSDLPISPRKLVYACYDAAKKQGLTRVRIGNKHLL